MQNYAIYMDASGDIDPVFAARNNIKIVPMNYTLGDEVELTVERNKAQEKIKLVLGSSADATSTLQSNQNQLPDNSGTEGGSGSDGFGGYGGYGGYGSGSDGGLGSLFGQ